ncbi:MAG: FecR family protein, partial [Balneolales bacterium]
ASLYFVQMEDDGSQQATDNVFEQVVTERGERAQVQLDDGSRIHLSVDSKLQQPREFSNTDRTVHLNGEAYFEIAHDDRPFFVHTKHAVVQI